MTQIKRLIAVLLLLTLFVSLTACGGQQTPAPTPTDTATADTTAAPAEETTAPEAEVTPVDPATLYVADTYETSLGSILHAYTDQTAAAFAGVCRYYAANGYTLYEEWSQNDNLFATYEKDDTVVHVYYQPSLSELNIVTDAGGISTLPEKSNAPASGGKTTVTQLKSAQLNGMGYVFRMPDGGFVIYDGGYTDCAEELWGTLVDLNGGEEGIHIHAWLLTHSHNDHTPCFGAFGKAYGARVQLDRVMYAPISRRDARVTGEAKYFLQTITEDIALFPGAKTCIPHTGMAFTFAGVRMEILLSSEEIYIDNAPDNFNNSSTVSVIRTEHSAMLLLGDSASTAAARLQLCYGHTLKSDFCQVSHHGVEDFPLTTYQLIDASVFFYPCSNDLYNLGSRDQCVRDYIKDHPHTKEILIHANDRYTREMP